MQRLWKLGGSLLSDSSFPRLFRDLVPSLPSAQDHIFVGGGQAVDLVRCWEPRFRLSDEDCHQLALAGMAFNTELVRRLLPEFTFVDPSEIREAEDAFNKLPRTWRLTSDSLSAWICDQRKFQELILVKSAPVQGHTLVQLKQAGVVDDLFECYRPANVKVGIVCLFDSENDIEWL